MDRGAWRATVHGITEQGMTDGLCPMLSHVWFFATLGTVAPEAPLFMGFPGQEYWSGLSFFSPGDLPDPGIKPASPALADWFFTTEPPGKPSLAGYSPWGRRFRYDWARTQASIRFPLPLKPFYELSCATWGSSKDKNRLSCALGRISSNDNGKV